MKKRVILIILFIVFALVLLFSGFQICRILLSNGENRKAYSDLANECVRVETTPTSVQGTEPTGEGDSTDNTVPNITIDFDKLHRQSKDAIGWLYLPGTVINYPVVQGTDNNFYLKHMANGEQNASGSLFADCGNRPDFSDYNTVIFGHNMKNHSMFGTLSYYQDQSYYNEHPVMYLYTESANYTLELICGFYTNGTSELYLIPAEESRTRSFVEYGISHSTFVSRAAVEEGDRLVTLSTCSYGPEGDRYVVMAKLTEQ